MYFIITLFLFIFFISFFVKKRTKYTSKKKNIRYSVSHEIIELNIDKFMKKNHIVDDIKKRCNVNENTRYRDLQDESDYEEYIKDISIQNKK